MKHHENNQPNNNTTSPFGQCIKSKRIMPENDNIHTVYPNLTATNVLDFATKVAVQTTTKAVKTVDKNQVLANQVFNLPRSRNTSNNQTQNHEKVTFVKIDDDQYSNQSSIEVLEKLHCYGSTIKKPVFLYIGYTTGYSIWLVSVDGDAYEIVSNRSGPVNHAKVLPTPSKTEVRLSNRESMTNSQTSSVNSQITTNSSTSLCSSYFPHLATVAAGSAEAECELVISSLVKPTYQVQSLSFSSKIKSLVSNRKLLIVSLESGQISGFHAHQNYTPVFNLDRDFPLYQTLSLGDRWLAFNEKSKWSQVCSRGGVKTFNDTSTITSNVLKCVYSVYSIAENAYEKNVKKANSGNNTKKRDEFNEAYVSIIDIDTMCEFGQESKETETDELGETRPANASVMFHFMAHKQMKSGVNKLDRGSGQNAGVVPNAAGAAQKPDKLSVTCLEFDPSGGMLASSDNVGHVFNVFKLHADVNCSENARVSHLYCLRRGETEASVTGLKWSLDSRLIAASTSRGTTHLFPVVPEYGGKPSFRSHGKPTCSNQYTDYERSAGLSDLQTRMQDEMTSSHYEPAPDFIDTQAYIRSSSPVETSLLSWSKSGDSILILDQNSRLQQVKICVVGVNSEVGVENELSIEVSAQKYWDLKRQPEWPSITSPLQKLNPVVFYSDLILETSSYDFLDENGSNSWVSLYLNSLHGYVDKNFVPRNRTSSWNFGSRSNTNDSVVPARKHDVGAMDGGEQDDSMASSLANGKEVEVKSENDNFEGQKLMNDWLQELEIQTCECDSRSLLQGPQFSLDFTCFETNSNNETPTTATNGKAKKKKGGGSKKATEANGKSENAILSKQHSNETSKQSFDLMEAMMDDFCVTKRGSERTSISHSFSVDDSTACDLAIELNPKKRVTRAGIKK